MTDNRMLPQHNIMLAAQELKRRWQQVAGPLAPIATDAKIEEVVRGVLTASKLPDRLSAMSEALTAIEQTLRDMVRSVLSHDPDESRRKAAAEVQKRAEQSEALLMLLWDNREGWSHRRDPFVPKKFWAKVGVHLFGEGDPKVREMFNFAGGMDGTVGMGLSAQGNVEDSDNPILAQANKIASKCRFGRGLSQETIQGILGALHANGLLGNQRFPLFTGNDTSARSKLLAIVNNHIISHTPKEFVDKLMDELMDSGLINAEGVDAEAMAQTMAKITKEIIGLRDTIDAQRETIDGMHRAAKVDRDSAASQRDALRLIVDSLVGDWTSGTAAPYDADRPDTWMGNPEARKRLQQRVTQNEHGVMGDVSMLRTMIHEFITGAKMSGEWMGNERARQSLADISDTITWLENRSLRVQKLEDRSRRRLLKLGELVYGERMDGVRWKPLLRDIAAMREQAERSEVFAPPILARRVFGR